MFSTVHYSHYVSLVTAVLAFLSADASRARAQAAAPSDPGVDTGSHWYDTYDGVRENISLASGNLSFCIPLASIAGPNGHDLTVPLCYNSQFQEGWVASGPNAGDTIPYFPWAWASNTPSGYTTPPMGVGWTFSGAPAFYMSNKGGSPVWFMPDGAMYAFVNPGQTITAGFQEYVQPGTNEDLFYPVWGTSSGQGPDLQGADLWSFSGSGPMLTKNGTKFTISTGASCPPMGCAEEQSPDGTTTTWTNNSITDAVGRTVNVQTAGSGFSSSTMTASSATINVSYPDSSGTTRSVQVLMQTMQFTCNNTGNGPVGSGGGPYSMPTAIILPNGLTYTFQYDACGMLRKVTYPTGGYTRYDYEGLPVWLEYGNGQELTWYQNQIIAKHVCPAETMAFGSTTASSYSSNNQCPVSEETTTYSPTYNDSGLGNANSQNIVVDPVGNKTIYQFAPPDSFNYWPAVETSRQMFDASGKLWRTIATQYTTTTTPGSTLNGGSGGYPVLPTIQTTTLDNGMVSQVQWSYDLWGITSNDSVLTEEREYDYGLGAAQTTPLKKTDYTWLHRDNPAVYGWPYNAYNSSGTAVHICDRKTSETVYDGSGKKISQTKYVYDSGNPASNGAHGLLTSVQRWRSTDGAWLATSYQYNGSYGNVTQMTDPKGNVTNYSYTDNYSDGVNRNSNAFLTKTTDPLGHVIQNQYYWSTGLVSASCGENFSGSCITGLSSGADYAGYIYDLLGRRTSSTAGDGGVTSTSYVTTNFASYYLLQIQTVNPIGVITSVTLDGEGRNIQSQVLSDPSCPGGTVNVNTTYDLDERESTVTNPYCSSSPGAPTAGTTTYAYDGLSRVTQITHPDGTYVMNTYTGRAVLSADEGNGTDRIQHISQADVLGRPIDVCEVTAATQQGSSNNTPSSCGLDISGSGFLTTYAYDGSSSNGPLEIATSVGQGGVNRSFIYDSLGELRSAANPESGTTTFSYDDNGKVTSKTDAKGITTTYGYDALDRLMSKSYSDGVTASACFEYDQNSSGHGIGRLTTEWTQMGACPSTPPSSGVLTQRTIGAYDPMGRVTSDKQCIALGACTSGSVDTLSYGYDFAGDITSFGDGVALSFTSQYNSSGRLSTVYGPQTQGGAATPLFEATAYTPAGALQSALIGVGTGGVPGINFQRSYNNRLFPTAETDTVATTPGTATVQITGSEEVGSSYGPGYTYGSVTFGGLEQCPSSGCDYGAFLVFIGSQQGSQYSSPHQLNYGQFDTPESLAITLAAEVNCSNSPVVAYAVGATVYFVSCSASNTAYSLSTGLAGYRYEGQYSPSFSVTASGSSLTPVTGSFEIPGDAANTNSTANAVSFYGTEQSGQTGAFEFFVFANSINNGPPIQSVTVNWGSTSTPSTLASALAAAFPVCSGSNTTVTAAVDSSETSGPTVVLSSCNSTTTYTISGEVAGYNPEGSGTTPSFIALTSGSWPVVRAASEGPTPTYDSGTVSLIVNGTQVAMASYGSSSTPASIASALASAGTGNGLVTLSASGANLTMTAIGNGSFTDYSYQLNVSSSESSIFVPPSFAGSPGTGTLTGGTNAPLYNWAINTYAPNGDVLSMTDSVMGTWSYTYDDFDRLTNGSATAGADSSLALSWTYDRYGNRWVQSATGSGNISAVQPSLTFSGNNNRVTGWSYDADGNLLNDGRNSYGYDAEGRITVLNSAQTYVYDAEGSRVAKYSGGSISAKYLLGLGDEQVTEINSSGAWVHSNVFVGGHLLGTYEGTAGPHPNTWHFDLTDRLGTKRMQTVAAGNSEETCYNYPFGDGLLCTGGPDATEHHFTGKERDAESGDDYFGARYLNSNLGRWMSPDPTGLALADAWNPQSLNLYSYVQNNPLSMIDPDGLQTVPDATCGFIRCVLWPAVARFLSSGGGAGDGGGGGGGMSGGGGGGGEGGEGGGGIGQTVPPTGRSAMAQQQSGFQRLWNNYPTYAKYPSEAGPGSFWSLAGGHQASNASTFVNSCSLRMCYALNRSGYPIPHGSGTSSDASGMWGIPRLTALQPFLTQTFGNPEHYGTNNWRQGVAGRTGIFMFQVHWSDASGHATLWNGSAFRDGGEHDYSNNPHFYGVLFWPVP